MYCKVGFVKAVKDARAMMRGSRAVIFMSMLVSVPAFFGCFLCLGVVSPKNGSVPSTLSSVSGFAGIILFKALILYVFSVCCFTLSARLWKDKVTVKSFFNNFLKFRRIAPFCAAILPVFLVYSLPHIFHLSAKSLHYSEGLFLFVSFAFFLVCLIFFIVFYLCVFYAGSTMLKTSEIFNVTLSNKGALRSIFSLFWCKIKIISIILLAGMAFAIVAGVVFGVATLVVHALGLAHAAGPHHFHSIEGVYFHIVFWVAFIYWLFPFVYLFGVASYGQVVKANIKEHDLPMNPGFLDSDK